MEIENSREEMPIAQAQLENFTRILTQYDAALKPTKERIIASENWWKLRNTTEEQKEGALSEEQSFQSRSSWLHNVICNKHADAMESYPEPNILPREKGDEQEAKMLSAIVPCILEQNGYEKTYSDTMWQKQKTGTGVSKVVWDTEKLGGLGDISISPVSLLNVYWEPGISDIQRSRYLFHTELCQQEVLEERYPELVGKLKSQNFTQSRFQHDDYVPTGDSCTVTEVYYHKYVEGKQTVQYCKYVGETVLFATENDPEMAKTGLYDHGRYPYVFDPLFPIEGSPCGYGYVDICRNPQTAIDILDTSFVKNARVGAVPRFFSRQDGNINEEEFLDMRKPIVHVSGNVDEASLRQIGFHSLDGVYVNVYDRKINELRQTSGNTETSTGTVNSGVTAASAIAALQEASGKGSRDATLATYRAYGEIVELVIELIRQFYDLPRKFRILGENGAREYVTYTNAHLRFQHQGSDFGEDMGYRMPVFDIKVSPQRRNAYSRVSQNELALQFFQLGFFNPQLTEQALMCLEMMEFDGKDTVMQMVAKNARQLQLQQLALGMNARRAAQAVQLPRSDQLGQIRKREPGLVRRARERAANATIPGSGSRKMG